MERNISIMLGKGSVNHNSRKFSAKNFDSTRTIYNRKYENMDIKQSYHLLFDDALKRYNDKQTRFDRIISNYYEKIRSSKQEKNFYEVIIQIKAYKWIKKHFDENDVELGIVNKNTIKLLDKDRNKLLISHSNNRITIQYSDKYNNKVKVINLRVKNHIASLIWFLHSVGEL